MQVQFKIPGEPKGKGRPRFARRGPYVTTYTPLETASYEDMVRFEYRQAAGDTFFEGPVEMRILAAYKIPKNTSKKKRELMHAFKILPQKKPDADNVAKIIADSLNAVAYRDDTQITKLVVERIYADEPFVMVKLKGVGDGEQSKDKG